MGKQYRILICPLEWGMGHAARSVPLARELMERGHEVIFAAGDKHLVFLKGEFPDGRFIRFPGFSPTYSRFLPMWVAMAIKSPYLLYHIVKEHFCLKRIVREYQIDIVISDNRFGLWNPDVRSVYITHQLRIKFPKWTLFVEPLVAYLHEWFIKKYDYCLVPDLPDIPNISGELSHSGLLPSGVRFVGLLSRFTSSPALTVRTVKEPDNYLLLILSGPEPQKTIFKEKIINALKDRELRLVVLGAEPGGTTGDAECYGRIPGNRISVTYYSHLPLVEMRELILNSGAIIARSGYTSIMELISLNRSALLVPTPGQTEQEYLAKTLSEKGWFTTINQNMIDNKIELNSPGPSWPASIMEYSGRLLEKTINELFGK